MRNICHWGPLLALGIIKLVSWTTIYCTTQWLSFTTTYVGAANAILFLILAYLTIYHFLCAMSTGPGFVPLRWHPDNMDDRKKLQYCNICEGYKAPRAHHCRKCNRCSMKMDHHCPWLNNCVGHLNHGHFISFLFFAICGSAYASSLLMITIYKVLFPSVHESGVVLPVRLSLIVLVLCLFSIGTTIGVCLALSFLLFVQIKSILRNRTGIEDWILEKAEDRRDSDPSLPPFIYPYNLGWKDNIRQVFYSGCAPQSDGINWRVREGCNVYDITVEQLKQKELKRRRKRPFKVISKYSGALLPLMNGFCTFLRPPYSTDSRMAIAVDDIILVTRYHRYWLYGEKISNNCKSKIKGWFPRSCVIYLCDQSDENYTKKKGT